MKKQEQSQAPEVGPVPQHFSAGEKAIWNDCISDWTHLTRNERILLIEFCQAKYEHDKIRQVWRDSGSHAITTDDNGKVSVHPLVTKIEQYKRTLQGFIKMLGGVPGENSVKQGDSEDSNDKKQKGRKPVSARKPTKAVEPSGNDEFYNQSLNGPRFGKGGPPKNRYVNNA